MNPRPSASSPLSPPAPRHRRRAVAACLLGALVVAACGTTSARLPSLTATDNPTATPGAAASSVEARLLVQQGLGIGLASNVVQSQVTVLTAALLG